MKQPAAGRREPRLRVDHIGLLTPPFRLPSRNLKSEHVHKKLVPDFDELLSRFIEEPAEVLGILSDVVNRGRIQAEDLPKDALQTLSDYDLVMFLFEKRRYQPPRTWVYPSALGLRTFALLEREAENDEPQPPKRHRRTRQRSGRRG